MMIKSSVIIFALVNIFILLFGLRVFMSHRMILHKVFQSVLIVDILTSIALMLILDWRYLTVVSSLKFILFAYDTIISFHFLLPLTKIFQNLVALREDLPLCKRYNKELL
jgi:hypothetical protein